MEFPARNEGHATQQNKKKQRRKTVLLSKIYMQGMLHAPQEQEPVAGADFGALLCRFILLLPPVTRSCCNSF